MKILPDRAKGGGRSGRSGRRGLLIWLAGSFAMPAFAQEEVLTDFAVTSSPRETMESFLDFSERAYEMVYDHAHGGDQGPQVNINRVVGELLNCLDLSQEAGFARRATGIEAAICLKEMLDRIELPPLDEIPGPDDLKTDSEAGVLEHWRVPHTRLSISRVQEGPRKGDYLFSPVSLASAIEQYDRVRELPYRPGASRNFYAWYLTQPGPAFAPIVNALPDSFHTRLIGRHALWQWLALGIVLLLGFVTIVLVYFFGRRIGRRLRETNVVRYALTLLFPIAAMLVPVGFVYIVESQIRLGGQALSVFTFSANIVLLLTGMIVIHGIGTRIAEFIVANPRIHPKGLDAQLVRVICRVLSLVAAVIVFLEGGSYLGIPLTTLLASAGVGGLALALAAQDSLKNFFGSMMIILDKPYRVGERIVVKGYDGIVEEIGLRSTRLRLLTGHQATIPNEEMARSDIENVGRRPHIRRLVDLRLPIDTPPEKAEKAVEIIREILEDHEGMDPEFPPRAYFTEITADALVLRMIYWFHPPVMWDFLEFSQGVNLRIQRAFDEAGITLEVPMRLLKVSGGDEAGENSTDEPSADTDPG